MDAMDIDLDFEAPIPQDLPEAQGIDLDLTYDPQPSAAEDVNLSGPFIQPSLPLLETEPEDVQQNKIHVRGLDDLSTKDIEAFSLAHFPTHQPHVEWIDDSSANLVFDTPEIASEAVQAITLNTSGDVATFHPLQLRAAKPLSSKPDVTLNVRIAVATDRKRPRAHEASRYYMMHPEADPREHRRQGGDHRRKRFGGRSRQDRDDIDDSFAASMYDDDADALAEHAERRNSNSSASSTLAQRGRRGRGRNDRTRNRSASPGRDGDDRNGRRRTPPPGYSRKDPNPVPKDNLGRELFPVKSTSNRNAASDLKKELFPKKELLPKKELFPNGAAAHTRPSALPNGNSAHREDPTDAAADLFSSRMKVPFVDGAGDGAFPLHSDNVPRRRTAADDFAIRGKGGRNGEDGGLRIRGMAEDQGFSIRGAAAEAQRARETDKKVKELFPNRLENKGKELFIKGRAGARQKADTFF